jgi:hypothetical protein
MKIIYKYILLLIVVLTATNCEEALDVEVFSELNPQSSSEEITMSILYNAYSMAQMPGFYGGIPRYYMSAMPSGENWNEGGSIARRLNELRNFNWASNHTDIGSIWQVCYEGIRDANTILENVEEGPGFQKQVRAEAKFIRGWLYYSLYDWFGPVPLRTSTLAEVNKARATDEEIKEHIEKDLTEAAADLLLEPVEHGRATKGAAYAALCKFYLNTKQWQKAADAAQTIMDMNQYSLLPNYADVFALDNEGNEELIWTLTRTAPTQWDNSGQWLTALTYPNDYPFPLPNQFAFGARTYYFDEFLDSFDENDERGELFIREYESGGEIMQLYGKDKSLSYKYPFDPASNFGAHGNDMPEVRYSDILLSRAEALNELNGPNQASIDLINQVKERAGAPLLVLSNYPDKASLNAAILQEREWEFWGEAKWQQDQIRHGVLISRAQARGKVNAKSHHVKYPIPLDEENANPGIVQNDGY